MPALGVPPEEVTDPIMTMLWGITSQQVELWLKASSSDSDGTISGFAGSPGVVEGKARLVRTVEDLANVEEGDIIICSITSPSWISAFQVAGGVVSDSGGLMSHAAIVCREYGIPAVVGTGIATQQIEDGQPLRLDGNGGVVTFLSEA